MFKKEQDVFNILFESVSEGVIVVNSHQNIVAANFSTEQMFGYQPKELIEKTLNVLIPQKHHFQHGAFFKGFLKHKENRQMNYGRDFMGVRKDGSEFPLVIGLNPFKIYGRNYIMALIVDVSERKQNELKILELNTLLEQKVKKRTEELNDVVSELKKVNAALNKENIRRIKAEEKTKKSLKKEIELNELKTKFLSMVSHEFKTPLSGILTSTILLGKYKLTEKQEKFDKQVKTITDKVHYLDNILNDFLSIEKLETGKNIYDFKDFMLSEVVNQVIYNHNMLLKQGQKINYPENIDEIALFQDKKILALSLSNVIHNAIKYSHENAVIDIFIEQKGKFTNFVIKDEGIGIPEKDQKNIFNRYFRAENALPIQGIGIGLNIIKIYLEKLGGSIEFISEEHKGSVFIIKIPSKAKL